MSDSKDTVRCPTCQGLGRIPAEPIPTVRIHGNLSDATYDAAGNVITIHAGAFASAKDVQDVTGFLPDGRPVPGGTQVVTMPSAQEIFDSTSVVIPGDDGQSQSQKSGFDAPGHDIKPP